MRKENRPNHYARVRVFSASGSRSASGMAIRSFVEEFMSLEIGHSGRISQGLERWLSAGNPIG